MTPYYAELKYGELDYPMHREVCLVNRSQPGHISFVPLLTPLTMHTLDPRTTSFYLKLSPQHRGSLPYNMNKMLHQIQMITLIDSSHTAKQNSFHMAELGHLNLITRIGRQQNPEGWGAGGSRVIVSKICKTT